MAIDIEMLTKFLQISDPKIKDLKEKILGSFDNDRKMRCITDRQCENREQTKCYACEREGGCLILNGVAYLALGEVDIAIKELEKANQHLRSKGEIWNQIIGLTLLGNAYEKNRKDHKALREFEKAYQVLTKNYLLTHSKDYIDEAETLKKKLENQLAQKDTNIKDGMQGTLNKAKFSLPSMPTYAHVQAGPNGPIWDDNISELQYPSIDRITLDDKPHEIFSLRQGDAFITLTSNKRYGWAKVSGDSMNAAKPIPIFENDFVLFYKSQEAENNAIIIASCPDKSGTGYKYVVKRFDKYSKLLISETASSNNYPPISINKDTAIIGVVIAVAKR